MNLRVYTILLLLVASTTFVNAQKEKESGNNEKRFYIKAFGGYGFITPGSYKVESRTSYTYQVNGMNRDTTIISLGKKGIGGGLRFGGGLGYIVNNFLNVGVDLEYLQGVTLENKKTYARTSSYNIVNSTLDYNVLTLTPNVVFKAKSSSNYYIYNRLGLLISLPFDLEYGSYDSTDYPLSTSSSAGVNSTYKSNVIRNATGQYKVPISLGLNVALGCQFKIAGNLRGFAEAFANFSVLSPKSYHEYMETKSNSTNTRTTTATQLVVVDISNSTSNLTNDYTYQKEGGIAVVYNSDPNPGTKRTTVVNGKTTTNTNTYTNNSSQTQTSSTISRNMNAIGLNIGIAYRF